MLRWLRAVVLSTAALSCLTAGADQPFCVQIGPPGDLPVDLFVAMNNGWLGARVIVRDQYHGKLVFQNLTTQPLQINLPTQLGARPVLAQQGFQFPGMNGPQSSGNQSSAPQAVGGNLSSSRGNNLLGAGPFSLAPEQVRIVDFPCFCLEQGKPNPRTAVKYELAPLDEVNADPRLPELLAEYARGDVEREAAQAAVWHAANKLSWDELAGLSRWIANGIESPQFNSHQLRRARSLVESAERQVAAKQAASKKQLATVAKPPRL